MNLFTQCNFLNMCFHEDLLISRGGGLPIRVTFNSFIMMSMARPLRGHLTVS